MLNWGSEATEYKPVRRWRWYRVAEMVENSMFKAKKPECSSFRGL